MTNDATPGNVPLSDQLGRLPTVARLYYTGQGSRRYKRASVHNGPGEALTFVSLAEQRVRQAVALECERLRAENERLAREAYTWSKAAETYAKQAQRTPLDPVDVEELWDKANADDAADEVHHAFARLLERAHGIGPN